MLTYETAAIVVQRCLFLGLDCDAEQQAPTVGINVKALMEIPARDFLPRSASETDSREPSPAQSVEIQGCPATNQRGELNKVKDERISVGEAHPGKSPALLKMWKDLGQLLPIAFYRGEDDPDTLLAWRKGVEQYIELYDVPAESQVLAATTFLRDGALKWWLMSTSTGQSRQITTLEILHERLRRRFFSPERQDELVYQWTTLRQTGTLAEYREKFFLLQTSLLLGEKAEYLLASLGLQPELRAEVQQEVDDQQVGYLPAERMFEVARKAELKSRKKQVYPTPEISSARPSNQSKEKDRREKGKPDFRKNGKSFDKNKDKQKGETDKAAMIRLNPYWVCDNQSI